MREGPVNPRNGVDFPKPDLARPGAGAGVGRTPSSPPKTKESLCADSDQTARGTVEPESPRSAMSALSHAAPA